MQAIADGRRIVRRSAPSINVLRDELEMPHDISDATPDMLRRWLSSAADLTEWALNQPGPDLRLPLTERKISRAVALKQLSGLRAGLHSHLRKATTERELSGIRDLIEETITDPATRRKVEERIDQASDAVAEADASEQAREAAFELERAKGIQDIRERRWRMWWSLLQREPIAVLVGAVLLIGFSVVLVVAMWTHTEVPEVVLNMILLILGFFFGQSTARGNQDGA